MFSGTKDPHNSSSNVHDFHTNTYTHSHSLTDRSLTNAAHTLFSAMCPGACAHVHASMHMWITVVKMSTDQQVICWKKKPFLAQAHIKLSHSDPLPNSNCRSPFVLPANECGVIQLPFQRSHQYVMVSVIYAMATLAIWACDVVRDEQS